MIQLMYMIVIELYNMVFGSITHKMIHTLPDPGKQIVSALPLNAYMKD